MVESRRGLFQYKPLKPQTLNQCITKAEEEPVRTEQEKKGVQRHGQDAESDTPWFLLALLLSNFVLIYPEL